MDIIEIAENTCLASETFDDFVAIPNYREFVFSKDELEAFAKEVIRQFLDNRESFD
jgi:hypothetical protein